MLNTIPCMYITAHSGVARISEKGGGGGGLNCQFLFEQKLYSSIQTFFLDL